MKDAELPHAAHAGQIWSCGLDCRYAAPLPGDAGDQWVYCSHLRAAHSLARLGSECPRFDSGPADAGSASPAPPRT